MRQPKNNRHIFFVLVNTTIIILFIPFSAYANEKLATFQHQPPNIEINETDKRLLDRKKSIFKTVKTPNGEQLAIIFKVDASPEKIWTTIKDYTKYKDWIKTVKRSDIYKTEANNIYVNFRVEHWLLGQYEYHIKHTFSSSQENWATWALDENKESDFLSAVGFWRVYTIEYKTESNTENTYVVYSSNLLFKKKKSTFVKTRAIKSSLKQASSWVKTQAEKL